MSATNRLRTLYPFYAWLALFYLAWLVLVLAGGFLHTVLAHWPMALAMAAGSYVAGSTPMGGGTVGFPVLVLLMDLPAALGRDFSFAIQAVGMTSASIYILCRRQELEWPMLRAALPGALLGTPLGIAFVAPLASDLFIKLLFASMWCSFGLLHLRRINEITGYQGMTPHDKAFDHKVGFVVGFFGGLTIALHDPVFIKWKPTVINWLFAAVFMGSHWIGEKPLVERMMSHAIQAPRPVWVRLSWMWIAFFIGVGILNLYVAFNFAEETWVNFKLFGILGITFAFVIAQAFYLGRYVEEPEAEEKS